MKFKIKLQYETEDKRISKLNLGMYEKVSVS